ncbi:hypothetical protein HYPSUDRAFT_97038, partial [Hypholoma sublateritium FD-334 SS-4]
EVSMSLLHGIAIISTCLRVEHRRRARRLWWDDYATIIPAVIEVLNIAVLWLRITHKPVPMEYKILYSYASSFFYSTIAWWSKISISLAVLRVIPAWSRIRPFAIAMPVIFLIFWAALFTTMITTCAIHTQWQFSRAQILICGPGYRITIVSTVLDVVADVMLVAVPLHQVWCIKRRASERRLVRLVFSSSMLTLVASI